MSSSIKPSTVLVTGANSFYAGAIMDRLVQDDVIIHAAVRRESARAYLEEKYGKSIKVFIVPDITKSDAFNDAIKDCNGVFHVASPIGFSATNNAASGVLDPAMNGARSALTAATTEPKIKRVVLTSSVAGMLDPQHESGWFRPGYTFTEKDWNPLSYEEASKLTNPGVLYTASKALAEKSAWAFMNEEPRHFDLVCVNPCRTIGRYTQELISPEKMPMTLADLSKMMDGQVTEVPATRMPWLVNISEVVQAQVNAMYNPKANGRYIIANQPFDTQMIADLMHEHFKDADWIKNVPRGTPGKKELDSHFMFDNTRSREELGVQYGPWQDCALDFCRKYQEDRKRFNKT